MRAFYDTAMAFFLCTKAVSSFTAPRILASSRAPVYSGFFKVLFSTDSRLFTEELNIIYDSKCNVCKLEIDFLRKRDESRNQNHPKLRFTDLEGETGPYDASDPANGGISYATGMASMHGVTPDGKVITGVPVFRQAYEEVGLGWLFAITKLPGVKQIADVAYNIFAKYRTRITRGQTIDELVSLYEEKKRMENNQSETDCETCKTN